MECVVGHGRHLSADVDPSRGFGMNKEMRHGRAEIMTKSLKNVPGLRLELNIKNLKRGRNCEKNCSKRCIGSVSKVREALHFCSSISAMMVTCHPT